MSTRTATAQAKTCALGSTIPAMSNDWSKYDGRADRDWLPQTRPMIASSTSASPKVRSTVDESGAPRSGRIRAVYMSQPSANIAGVVIRIPASGSIPSWSQSVKARKAPRIRRAPWAMLITFITPKISVSPDANSA